MNSNMPGFPVHHRLPELAQTHVHWVEDAIQSSHPVTPFSSCPQSFPATGSFSMSGLFTSGGQSTGTSTSASVLPMSIQGWFPLGLAGLIFLLSKGPSRVLQPRSSKASILRRFSFHSSPWHCMSRKLPIKDLLLPEKGQWAAVQTAVPNLAADQSHLGVFERLWSHRCTQTS